MGRDDGSLRISQYAYFALRSETTPAATVTRRLGVEPDRISVRGARLQDPPRPVCHVWAVECRAPGLTVDEQIAAVLTRIRPVADGIRALVAAGEVAAVLQVVRYFADEDGERERHAPAVTDTGVVLHVLPGQHHLLGWHLTAADLAFLVSVNADLDVDEYG